MTNPKEPRSIWLVTKDGVPQHCAWALVKTQAEAEVGQKSWAAALDAGQLVADGWDATQTLWRRVPMALRPGLVENAVVTGRDVTCIGLSYNLDTGGRVHMSHSAERPQEPYEPDAVVADEDELLDGVEAFGGEIRFVEKDTLKGWRASHIADDVLGAEDVLIARVAGSKSRANKT